MNGTYTINVHMKTYLIMHIHRTIEGYRSSAQNSVKIIFNYNFQSLVIEIEISSWNLE